MKTLRAAGALLLVLLLAMPMCALAGQAFDYDPALDAYDSPGVRIGVSTGALAMSAAEQRFPEAEIVYFKTDMDGVTALELGHIDAYAHDAVTLRYISAQRHKLAVLEAGFGSTDIAVGVSKSRDDLLPPINAALAELCDAGVLSDMLERWIGDAESAMPEIPAPENPDQTLRVGTAGLVVPMTYYGDDGHLTGYDLELTARLALALNAEVEIYAMGFDALVAGLQSGRLDMVVSNLNITPERAQMIHFSDPYIQAGLTLLVKADAVSGEPFSTLADLQSYFGADKRIGVEIGTIFDQVAARLFPDAQVVYGSNATDTLIALKEGRCDGYLVDKPRAIAQCLADSTIWMPEAPVMEDRYALIMPLGSEVLQAQVNQTLTRLRERGDMERLEAKWFMPDEEGKDFDALEYTGENGTLTLCSSSDNYPFNYIRDGEVVGYEVELFLHVCAEHGYTPRMQAVEFNSLLASIATGRADIAASSISITEERMEKMLFSEPTYIGGVMMVLPASVRDSITLVSEAEDAEQEGFFEGIAASFERTFLREGRWRMILDGLLITVVISACSGVLGTILGFGVCMARRSRNLILRKLAGGFIQIVQGTPIVVMLMILFYLVLTEMNEVLVAIIGFAINLAAYVSEMMRTGIEAVDRGQMEAASAMGFRRFGAFVYITLPQAARHFLPVFRGEFISLVKMTSVVGYITVMDLTRVSDIIRSRTYETFFPLITTALIYFLLAWLLTSALSALEKRIDPKRKKRELKGVNMQ